MKNNTTQQTTEKRPYYGGGRKKLSPEDKKVSVKKSRQKFKEGKRIFQAEIVEDSFQLVEEFKEALGLRSNAELLYWLLERGRNSLARKKHKS